MESCALTCGQSRWQTQAAGTEPGPCNGSLADRDAAAAGVGKRFRQSLAASYLNAPETEAGRRHGELGWHSTCPGHGNRHRFRVARSMLVTARSRRGNANAHGYHSICATRTFRLECHTEACAVARCQGEGKVQTAHLKIASVRHDLGNGQVCATGVGECPRPCLAVAYGHPPEADGRRIDSELARSVAWRIWTFGSVQRLTAQHRTKS